MKKKTLNIAYDIGEEVGIKMLNQVGIVSCISIQPKDHLRYQVEHNAGGQIESRWMDDFELEKPNKNTIGFEKKVT